MFKRSHKSKVQDSMQNLKQKTLQLSQYFKTLEIQNTNIFQTHTICLILLDLVLLFFCIISSSSLLQSIPLTPTIKKLPSLPFKIIFSVQNYWLCHSSNRVPWHVQLK